MDKLYDIYKRNVPVNARTFLESMFTNRPITENDFTPEELNVLRLIHSKGGVGPKSYFDYPTPHAQRGAGFIFDDPIEVVRQSYRDPAYSMMGTLGSFNTKETPDAIQVEDRYNFDNKDIYKMTGNETLPQMLQRMWRWRTSPAGALDQLMIRYANIDRPVNIKLNK